MTLLGIDYGRVHVGLAIGHTETGMALPLLSLHGRPRHALIEEIRELAKLHGVGQYVVGLPISMTGSEQASSIREEAQEFGKQLASLSDRPAVFIDERLTTKQANQLRHDFPQADEHALAAMIILQQALDQAVRQPT